MIPLSELGSKPVEILLLSLLFLAKYIIISYKTEITEEPSRTAYNNDKSIIYGTKISNNETISNILTTFREYTPSIDMPTSAHKRIAHNTRITPVSHTHQTRLFLCELYLNWLLDSYTDDYSNFKSIIKDNKMNIISFCSSIIVDHISLKPKQGGFNTSHRNNRKLHKNNRTYRNRRKFNKQIGGNFVSIIKNIVESFVTNPTITLDDYNEIFNFLKELPAQIIQIFNFIVVFMMTHIKASSSHDFKSNETIIQQGNKKIKSIKICKHYLDVSNLVDGAVYIIDKLKNTIYNKETPNLSFSKELESKKLDKLYHVALLVTLDDDTDIIVEKNPAVDIYVISKDEYTEFSSKNGFETYDVKLEGEFTFSWFINTTQMSAKDGNTFFNYRLFDEGTCQNFADYFLKTLDLHKYIDGTILTKAEDFTLQPIDKLKSISQTHLGTTSLVAANAGQTTFFLVIIGKRQMNTLYNKVLNSIKDIKLTAPDINIITSLINNKKVFNAVPLIVNILIHSLIILKKGGYGSHFKKTKQRQIKKTLSKKNDYKKM
jgi:hypothetical protein